MSCNAKKDPKGTWRIQYRWIDWTGTKKKSQKTSGIRPLFVLVAPFGRKCFSALRWRGIATRYAKIISSFLAVVQIRCIAIWCAILT